MWVFCQPGAPLNGEIPIRFITKFGANPFIISQWCYHEINPENTQTTGDRKWRLKMEVESPRKGLVNQQFHTPETILTKLI